MSLIIADNFNYKGRKPLDSRLIATSLSDLTSISESTIYDGILVYVVSEKKYYTYDSTNVNDTTLGKWREFDSGDDDDVSGKVKAYISDTDFFKDDLILFEDKLVVASKDFTSSHINPVDVSECFEDDVTNDNLILINTDHKDFISAYAKNTFYEKDTLVYYENRIYRVLQNFTSDNTEDYSLEESIEADAIAENILHLNKEVEHIIKPYEQNKMYEEDMLVYTDRIIAKVVSDYISDNTESSLIESINLDISNGNLTEIGEEYRFKLYKTTQDLEKTIGDINTIPISAIEFENGEDINNMRINEAVYGPLGTIAVITSINKNTGTIKAKSITARDTEIMPYAPDTCEFDIVLAGTGYQVGDILETSDQDILVEVTSVGTNGEITGVERTNELDASSNGAGASVITNKIIYGGNSKEWYEIHLANSTKVMPYVQNKNYEKDNLIYFDGLLYCANMNFTSNATESSLNAAVEADVTGNYLIPIEGKIPTLPECLGGVLTESELPTENLVNGNWLVVSNCNVSASGQAGIAIRNGNSWEIIPIPSGETQFPEPIADGEKYFRSVESGGTNGSWVKFEGVDGNEYKITINNKTENDNSADIPAANELVWYTKVDDGTGEVSHELLVGDGVKTLAELEPFYLKSYGRADIINLIGFEPESSLNKGQANGYAPLDENGKVPEGNLPDNLIDAYSKDETDTLIDGTATMLTAMINAESSRATTIEGQIQTSLTDHVDNDSIHVTQNEKDTWDAKVDEDALLPFTNHISDTAIHVTQSDKDKWDGMQQAYFVTKVADLPTTASIGNIGYVQTSAAGVVPIVCEQYLWDGTAWKLLDSEGVSITFNWDNLIGKPAATPMTIDNVVTIAHNHTNKSVLDKIGQSAGGAFTYDGIEIGIKALFYENDELLPEEGSPDTLYVVYADSRTRQYPSVSVYKDDAFQILGKGAQENAPVVGDMQILQAEYYSVKANSSYTINYSTPNQFFCFLPVEILKEIAGATNQNYTLVNFDNPNNFSYNENFLKIDSTSFCTIDKKILKTTIETVSDDYISYVEVNIDDYKDIEGIS